MERASPASRSARPGHELFQPFALLSREESIRAKVAYDSQRARLVVRSKNTFARAPLACEGRARAKQTSAGMPLKCF